METIGKDNSYWVTNPSSGAKIFMRVYYPTQKVGGNLPMLTLIPGGSGWSDGFTKPPSKAQMIADAGFVVVVFDPDGRGQSGGKEDLDGYIHQDGLAAVVIAAKTLSGVDTNRLGMVSYSYGVTMGSGAIARHPEMGIRFFIDWEGPVNRMYTTTGCREKSQVKDQEQGKGRIQWPSCSDDAAWAEREALNFIGYINVPYQRIQTQEDHVQKDNKHAIDIINAAVKAGLPWVRLNDYPINQTYDPENPPAMLDNSNDRNIDKYVVKYAKDILEVIR